MALQTASAHSFAESFAADIDGRYVSLRFVPRPAKKDGNKYILWKEVVFQPDEEDSEPKTLYFQAGFLNSHVPTDDEGNIVCGDITDEDEAKAFYDQLAVGEELIDADDIDKYAGTKAGYRGDPKRKSYDLPSDSHWADHVQTLIDCIKHEGLNPDDYNSDTDYVGLHVHLTSLPARKQMKVDDPNAKPYTIYKVTQLYKEEEGSGKTGKKSSASTSSKTSAGKSTAGTSKSTIDFSDIESAIEKVIEDGEGSVMADPDTLGPALFKLLDKKRHPAMIKLISENDQWLKSENRPWTTMKVGKKLMLAAK